MAEAFHLYIDDSGTRHPNKRPPPNPKGRDWFALGGVLVRDVDEEHLRELHASLVSRWPQMKDAPLHSSEIRARKDAFSWLGTDKQRAQQFMQDLADVVVAMPIIGIACVIDCPGYARRYEPQYAPAERWYLCKTAFTIVLERAAKFAASRDCRLRVFVERSDKQTDTRMREYYNELRTGGMPFKSQNMAKYAPLSAESFAHTLIDFKTKGKTSVPMQIADIILWPICMGAYEPNNRSYSRLAAEKKLIDARIPPDAVEEQGIKYSCFDSPTASAVQTK